MSTGILDVVKRAAWDVIENSQMCDLRYGTVVSVSPLKVKVTSQFIIPQSLLVVPKQLTNWTVDVKLDSDEAGGTSKLTIYNALKIGDKVALLRQQGGQSYFILDRI